MTQQHPITPPSELLDKWYNLQLSTREIFVIAARWGWDQREPELQERADQELEACVEWLEQGPFGFTVAASDLVKLLRAARRPKPPSLKQEALIALIDRVQRGGCEEEDFDTIRRALELLPDDTTH
jgi:hypothetical protein